MKGEHHSNYSHSMHVFLHNMLLLTIGNSVILCLEDKAA